MQDSILGRAVLRRRPNIFHARCGDSAGRTPRENSSVVPLGACFENQFYCRSRREEAQISGSPRGSQSLLTSAPTFLKDALGISGRRHSTALPYLATLLLLPLCLQAADPAPTPAQLQFFESRVRPVLVNNCYKCHSRQTDKLKGNLSVEFRESLIKGGDTGPAVVPGDPANSLLIKAIRYEDADLQMPPKAPLTDQQIDDLTAWVKMGAPDPRVAGSLLTSADWGKNRKEHWSFQPVKKVEIPAVTDSNWVATPVDSFILAKLEANHMKPAAAADKHALLRRATYDLTGLPPTAEEMDAFVNDPSPDAYAKVVDRLLASPQYGERWGRYWLDTARYSDTKGDIKQQQDVPQCPVRLDVSRLRGPVLQRGQALQQIHPRADRRRSDVAHP